MASASLELETILMSWSRDTNPEARRVQIGIWRRMPAAKKLELVGRLNAMARHLVMEGLRQRHPQASPDQIEEYYFQLILGPELAAKVLEARRARLSTTRRSRTPAHHGPHDI